MTPDNIRSYYLSTLERYKGISFADNLREKLILAYAKHIIETVETLLTLTPTTTDELANHYETFLQENARLINGTVLSYTCNTTPEINQLLYAIALYVYEFKKGKEDGRALLQLLIPSLKGVYPLDPLKQDYPQLDGQAIESVEALEHIMETHILGKEGHYLLPVKLILNEKEKWLNPYYDVFESDDRPDLVWVNDEERERIRMHSPKTQALHYTRENVKRLVCDDTSFLGHLEAFIRALKACSVAGGGKEYRASDRSFKVIFDFFDYYDGLGEEKNNIPKEVQAEIKKIRHYSSSKESFVTQVMNGMEVVLPSIESCAYTRYNNLEEAKNKHEKTLASIGTDEGLKRIQLEKAKKVLEAHKADFLTSDERSYKGHDTLGFNLGLLNVFNIDFAFKSLQDIYALKGWSVSEIEEVLSLQNNQLELMNAIGSIENLLILSLDLSHDQLKTLLRHIASYLPFEKKSKKNRFFYNKDDVLREEIASYLMALDEDRARIVFDLVLERLKSSIKTVTHFINFYDSQPDFVKKWCYDSFKHKLYDIVAKIGDLAYLLSVLETDEIKDFCKMIRLDEEASNNRDNGHDYATLFIQLSPEQIQACLEIFTENFMQTVLNDPEQLSNFFDAFHQDIEDSIRRARSDDETFTEEDPRLTVIYHMLKERLTTTQKRLFMRFLPKDDKHAIFEEVKQIGFLSVLKYAGQFAAFYDVLTPEDKTQCYNEVKDELRSLLFSQDDCITTLIVLDEEKQKEQLSLYGMPQLKSLVESSQFYQDIVPLLPAEQQWPFIYETIKEKPDIIRTVSDFVDVLEILPLGNCDAFLQLIEQREERLTSEPGEDISRYTRSKFFKRPWEFVVKCLPFVLESTVPTMPTQGLQHFISLYHDTELFNHEKVKTAYEKTLSDLVVLAHVMVGLSKEDRQHILGIFHSFILHRLDKKSDLSLFLSLIKDRILAWNVYSSYSIIPFRDFILQFMPVLQASILSPADLISFLSELTLEYNYQAVIINAFNKHFNEMPITEEQFTFLYSRMSSHEDQYCLFYAYSGQLAAQIESIEDFNKLVKYFERVTWDLKWTQSKMRRLQKKIFEHLNPSIREIVKSPEDLNTYLNVFNTYSTNNALSKLDPHVLLFDGWHALFKAINGLRIPQIKKILQKSTVVGSRDSTIRLDIVSFSSVMRYIDDAETRALVFKYKAEVIAESFKTDGDIMRCLPHINTETLIDLIQFLKKRDVLDHTMLIRLNQTLSRKHPFGSGLSNRVKLIKALSKACTDECLDILSNNDKYLSNTYSANLACKCFSTMWFQVAGLLDNDGRYKNTYCYVNEFEWPISLYHAENSKKNRVFYTLVRTCNDLMKSNVPIAIEVQKAFKDIVDQNIDKGLDALREALIRSLHSPDARLYQALNTHTSMIPITLYSPDGRFGFFSQNTNSLRAIQEVADINLSSLLY